MLGRCRRHVLIVDSGNYRNSASHGVHGFLSRDGIPPADLLAISRKQLEPYRVEFCEGIVKSVSGILPDFQVCLASGEEVGARRVLLATGVVDEVPKLKNVEQFYGASVHHCPYCDGWEHSDQPLVAYGKGKPVAGLAMSLKTWSDDVVICTDGPAKLAAREKGELAALRIPIHTARIDRLEGTGRTLERVVFANGSAIDRRAIFFNTGQKQACSLAGDLKCVFTHKGAIQSDRRERTSVPGIFAAGDCSRDVQFVAVAVAEGAIAAEEINIELQAEDRAVLLSAIIKT